MDEPRIFQPHTDTETKKNVQKVMNTEKTSLAVSANYKIKICIIMFDWIKAVDEPKIFQAHTDTETEKKVQKLMNTKILS